MNQEKLISSLLDTNNIHELNRLAATGLINKTNIINQVSVVLPDLYSKKSAIHGIGVFSHTPINKEQIIENVNILALEFPSKYHKDSTIMNYCYAFPGSNQNYVDQHGNILYMFTGFGMLYNHQPKDVCNAQWLWDLPNNSAKLIAKKKIVADTEITIDYGNGYWNRTS